MVYEGTYPYLLVAIHLHRIDLGISNNDREKIVFSASIPNTSCSWMNLSATRASETLSLMESCLRALEKVSCSNFFVPDTSDLSHDPFHFIVATDRTPSTTKLWIEHQ